MQKVTRGENTVEKAAEVLKTLGMQKPLLICSARLRERLEQALSPLPHAVFTAYHPNPAFSDCVTAAELFRAEGCDGLVSMGGGSAMDTAKCVKALLCASDDDHALRGELDAPRPLPHLTIPATAGTGSEATELGVIYVDHVKHSVEHASLLPDAVILDPTLLKTLPEYHKKSCALDALCQGIESYWARKADEDSQVDAFLAFTGVLDNLTAYLAGDAKAAEAVQYAAYCSGRAICVTRTTAAHAMAYKLTTDLGVAHGHACMLTLPAIWEAMLDNEDVLPVLMDLAQKMRLSSEYLVPKLLWGILYDLDMPFPDLPDDKTLDELAAAVNVSRLHNNPMPFTTEQLREIYRKALTPKCEAEKQACLDIWRYWGK